MSISSRRCTEIGLLKAPVNKRLKPNYDEPLPNFAFTFNLRRYSLGGGGDGWRHGQWQGLTLVHFSAQLERFLWDGGCA
jgi:hypothetical protein